VQTCRLSWLEARNLLLPKYKEPYYVVTNSQKPQNHKTTKPQNHTRRITRFESLESRLCLSGCDISGNVYDARFDPGEMPLAGIRIFLDDGDGIWESGEDWTISDGSGNYSFSDLQPPSYPAEYTVAQVEPEGYGRPDTQILERLLSCVGDETNVLTRSGGTPRWGARIEGNPGRSIDPDGVRVVKRRMCLGCSAWGVHSA